MVKTILLQLCCNNAQLIINTFVQHQDFHNYTSNISSLDKGSLTDFCFLSADSCQSVLDLRVINRRRTVDRSPIVDLQFLFEITPGPTRKPRTNRSHWLSWKNVVDNDLRTYEDSAWPLFRKYPTCAKTQTRSGSMVAHGSHPKLFLFLAFFKKIKNKKNVSQNKTILLSFRKHFRFANVFRVRPFSLKKKIILVLKTLSFRKCFLNFLNENIFVLKKNYFRFGNTFTFVSETFRKNIEKNRISFVVVAHACHPPLRASVSTWEGLICKFFYVDVWLQ